MSVTQPSPTPPAGQRPRLRDLGWLSAYSLRGLAELVRARLIFSRFQAKDLLRRNRAAYERASVGVVVDAVHLARIAYVLPRISARLPWRSDCLIQAIAGQNWLASMGLASEIRVGVQRSQAKGFGAHAWLVYEEMLVSGGDIGAYDQLLGKCWLCK